MSTYHNVQDQGKLIIQSRENSQKPQLVQFLDGFGVKHLQIANFSEKKISLNWRSYSVLT